MPTYNADVPTVDGFMDCFIAHPDGEGPFAPIILYMDVPGIRQELEDFAQRLAADGYMCVLPDLYYRDGKVRFDLSKGAEELQRMFLLRKVLDGMEDAQAIEFLIERLKSSKTNEEFFSAMKTGVKGKKK